VGNMGEHTKLMATTPFSINDILTRSKIYDNHTIEDGYRRKSIESSESDYYEKRNKSRDSSDRRSMDSPSDAQNELNMKTKLKVLQQQQQ
jgi:hypothetical protein